MVYEGATDTIYNNAYSTTPYVKWEIVPSTSPSFNSYAITNYDNIVDPAFLGIYNVTPTDLTITTATGDPIGSNSESTAGLYILYHQSPDCNSAGNLIVISKLIHALRDSLPSQIDVINAMMSDANWSQIEF